MRILSGAEVARLFAERGAAGLVICGRSVAKGEVRAKAISAPVLASMAAITRAVSAVASVDGKSSNAGDRVSV